MPFEYVDRFYALFFTGLGLLLAGLANAPRPNQSARGRLLVTAAVFAAVLGGLWAVQPDARLLGRTAAVLTAPAAACLLAGSSWVAAGARVVGLLRRPPVRWGLLAVAGLACVVGSVARFEAEEEKTLDAHLRDLDMMAAKPPLDVAPHVRATTDRGTEVTLKRPAAPRGRDELTANEQAILGRTDYLPTVLRRGPADEVTNCHGWVFTGGRFWVAGESVESILSDNGYATVSTPRPGDLVIYRNDAGVTHTAVVRYVTPGMPVLVEGKWAWMGVFLHRVGDSIFGPDYTFLRSPRPGHLLAGLSASAAH